MNKGRLKGISWLFISKFFPPIINFSVFAYSARILDPEDFGVVALALSIVYLCSCAMPSGWREALIKYQIEDEHVISSIFWLNFFVGSILTTLLIGYSVLSFLLELHDPYFNISLIIFSMKITIDGLYYTLNILLLKKHEYSKIALRTIFTSIVSAIIILTLLYFDYGIFALIIVQPLISLANFFAVYIPTRKYILFRFSWKDITKLNGFSIYASLTDGMNGVIKNYESVVMGAVLGFKELGFYNLAKRLTDIISDIFINTLNEVSYPTLATKQFEKSSLESMYLNLVYFSVAILYPFFIFCIIESDAIFTWLFTEKWLGASMVFQFFCIGCLFIIPSVLQKNNNYIKQ